MAEKNKGGRPAHQPTDADRKLCRTLSGYGVPQEEIARQIGIHQETLRTHYRDELDGGIAQANAKVAESLFKRATSDGPQAVSAAIFWMKTRAGWRDVNVHEHTGKDGGAIQTESKVNVDVSKLSNAAMAELLDAAIDTE